MHHLVQVRIFDRRDDLLEKASGFSFVQALPHLDQIEKFAHLCKLKHNKDVRLTVNVLVVFANVRVIEAPEDLDLTTNLLKDSLLFDLALVQNFDCNLVTGHLIYGH